jgi:hypothetical protein
VYFLFKIVKLPVGYTFTLDQEGKFLSKENEFILANGDYEGLVVLGIFDEQQDYDLNRLTPGEPLTIVEDCFIRWKKIQY